MKGIVFHSACVLLVHFSMAVDDEEEKKSELLLPFGINDALSLWTLKPKQQDREKNKKLRPDPIVSPTSQWAKASKCSIVNLFTLKLPLQPSTYRIDVYQRGRKKRQQRRTGGHQLNATPSHWKGTCTHEVQKKNQQKMRDVSLKADVYE